jgi:hypothetical protein
MDSFAEGLTHGSIWPDDSSSGSDDSDSYGEEQPSGTRPTPPTPVPEQREGCRKALFGIFARLLTRRGSSSPQEAPAPAAASEEQLSSLPKEVRELVARRRQKFT